MPRLIYASWRMPFLDQLVIIQGEENEIFEMV